MGTWAMGGGVYGEVDDDQSSETIRRAHELGVNTVDTAPIYGMGAGVRHAETLVGRAIRGARDSWIVCTKWGRNLDAAKHGVGDPRKMEQDFSYDRALRSVEESLERLGTDYVDVYFVHSPSPNTLFDPRSLDAMDELQAAGVIGLRGFSARRDRPGFRPDRGDRPGWPPRLRAGRLQPPGSIAYAPAARPLLGVRRRRPRPRGSRPRLPHGSFTAEDAFPPTDFRSILERAEIERRLELAERFRFLTEDGRSLAHAAVSWVLSHEHVASVIVGAKNVGELDESVAAARCPPFDDTVLARVAAVTG